MGKKKAIIVSGYFNPIHKGHLEYFNNAKALCDELFVIVNNDHQRELKGSNEFQKEDERMIIVSNIKAVNKAVIAAKNHRRTEACYRYIGFATGMSPVFTFPFTAQVETGTAAGIGVECAHVQQSFNTGFTADAAYLVRQFYVDMAKIIFFALVKNADKIDYCVTAFK